MSQKFTIFLLQFTISVNIITAQIHFPDERNPSTAQGTRNAPVYVPNSNIDSMVADLTYIDRDPENSRIPANNQGSRTPGNQQGFRVSNEQALRIPYEQQGSRVPNNQQELRVPNNQQGSRVPNNQQGLRPPNNNQQVSRIPNQQDPESILVRGINQLTLDINRIVPRTSPDLANANNIVYGPLTIAGALTLVLLASIGQTYNEIANALGFSSGLDIQNNPLGVHEHIARLSLRLDSTTGINFGEQVNYALAIFVQKDFPIRPDYRQASKELYNSDIVNLDFRGNPLMAQTYINSWVSNRTNDKIPNLLNDYPPPNTRAIIVGVLYFKASWEYPFFEGHTKWRPFFVNGRKNPSDRMAEMMSNGGEFPYFKDTTLGVEIMGFPYKGKHSTMYVILPNDSNIEKLKKLENSLTANDIEYLINSTRYTEAVVLFPKMQLESTIDLGSTLQTLGINSLFSPYQANLALLSPTLDQKYNIHEEAPFVSQSFGGGPSTVQRPSPPPQPSRGSPSTVQRPSPPPQPSRGSPSTVQRPPPPRPLSPTRPLTVPHNNEDLYIFSRFGSYPNCTPVFDPITNRNVCRENIVSQQSNRAKRAQSIPSLEALDNIRRQVSENPQAANPGIYADQVIHKVYMDITESGTEAAAATGISLNRSGGRVTFRVDIPFLFFIYNEDTRIILFWGSVKSPTPSVATPST